MDGRELDYAELFVTASDLANAIEQVKERLFNNKLELIDTSKGLRYIPTEWKKAPLKIVS